ncbi:hypothetical protein FOVSG1_004287 [Fusarium oxysporum f. sp. vasinfectum]
MELSWFQNLNLLLTRTVGACHQTSDRRNKVVDEVKHVLLCLANRRKLSRGRLVVTNEHLTRALHYFDILILITDVTFDKEEETSIPQSDHFRNPNIADLINGTPNTHQPPSNTQPGSSSSTSTKRQSDNQNAASYSSTTLPAKRRASDGPLYSLFTSQKRKERKSTTT